MRADLVQRPAGRRVVLAIPLERGTIDRLAGLVGTDVSFVDIRAADGSEDLVLTPAVSRQLLGKLRAAFPDAQVIVVELDDPEEGIRLGGPVTRAMEAGAAGYFVAASLEQLAGALQPGSFQASLDTATPAAALPAADEPELSQVLDAILTARATEPARFRRDTDL